MFVLAMERSVGGLTAVTTEPEVSLLRGRELRLGEHGFR